MDDELLQFRKEELRFLDKLLGPFAVRHQAEASSFDLYNGHVGDPHLQQFLEGVAALTARVRLRFEHSWSEFLDTILWVTPASGSGFLTD